MRIRGKTRPERRFDYNAYYGSAIYPGSITWIPEHIQYTHSGYKQRTEACHHFKFEPKYKVINLKSGTLLGGDVYGHLTQPPVFAKDLPLLKPSIADFEDKILSSGLDLTVDLLEIAEIGGLIQSGKKAAQSLSNVSIPGINSLVNNFFASRIGAPVTKANRKTANKLVRQVKRLVKDPTKTFSDNYLTVMFGIMPLLGTLQGSIKALSELEESWEDFKSGFTTPSRVSIGSKYRWKDEPRPILNHPSVSGVIISEAEVRQTAGIRATYTLGGSNSYPFPARVNWMIDHFGLSPDWSDFWQVVPLSFVIDWFIPISDILDDLDINASGLDLHIKDGWTSCKFIGKSYTEGFAHADWQSWTNEDYFVADWTVYRRQPFKPSGLQTVSHKIDLSGGQFLSLAALGRQRL